MTIPKFKPKSSNYFLKSESNFTGIISGNYVNLNIFFAQSLQNIARKKLFLTFRSLTQIHEKKNSEKNRDFFIISYLFVKFDFNNEPKKI